MHLGDVHLHEEARRWRVRHRSCCGHSRQRTCGRRTILRRVWWATDLHQMTIINLRWGINEAARTRTAPGQAVALAGAQPDDRVWL